MTEATHTPTQRRSPVGVDTALPSIPRVYNYSLGGKDNYDADIRAWNAITEVAPKFARAHIRNRAWIARATRYLAQNASIHQFIELGAGLPNIVNTHQYAQEWDRHDVEFLYIDNDPVCVAHGQGLMETNETVHYLPGDLTDPEQIVEASIRVYFDPDRPIALIFGGVLHHIGDDQCPAEIMARYINMLPGGSYVAISHYADPGPAHPERHQLARDLEHAFLTSGLGSGWFRTHDQIQALFGGLELVPPGLVELDNWWPEGPLWERDASDTLMVGGIAYKNDSGPILRSVK